MDALINLLLPAGIAGYLLYLWQADLAAQRAGSPATNPIPGATPSTLAACVIGAIGALIIVAVETGGEIALGIASEQKTITILFIIPMLAAAIYEEVIFRGFLVVRNRGRAALVASIFGFSLIFGLLHDFLWSYTIPEDAESWEFWKASLELNLSLKGWFSFTLVLLNSFWFYAVRFLPQNPERSLLPCFIAHAVSNLGVYVVKASQGFVEGWL